MTMPSSFSSSPRDVAGTSALDLLLRSHNGGEAFAPFPVPRLVLLTCMDFRIRLRLPENFAFVLRTGGARGGPVETELAFALGRCGIDEVAVIGHTDCAMRAPDPAVYEPLHLGEARTDALKEALGRAAVHDEVAFTTAEAERLSRSLGVRAAPFLYDVRTHLLRDLSAPSA